MFSRRGQGKQVLFYYQKKIKARGIDDFKVFSILNLVACFLLLMTLISLKIARKIKTDKIN